MPRIQATDGRGAKMPQKLDGDSGQCVQQKNGPEDRGHSTKVGFRLASRKRMQRSAEHWTRGAQSPTRGRSPLRFAISALFISSRSMVDSSRLNRVLEGVSAMEAGVMEAVLDMVSPFLVGGVCPPRDLKTI